MSEEKDRLMYESLHKEYEYIREKMRRFEQQRIRIATFSIGAWIAVLSFFEKTGVPQFIIPFLLLLIVTVALAFYWENRYGYVRCHTYIEVFIERKIPWLQWETITYNFYDVEKGHQSKFDKLFRKFIAIANCWLCWLAFSSVVIAIERFYNNGIHECNYYTYMYLGMVLVWFMLLAIGILDLRKINAENFRSYWKSAYHETNIQKNQ